MFNLPTISAKDELKFVKNQLKKIEDLDTMKKFKDLSKFLPRYYEKKL